MTIRVIGKGGHAKVVNDLIRLCDPTIQEKDATIVAIGDNKDRRKEAEALGPQHTFLSIAHPFSYIAPGMTWGGGCVIMAGAVIQPGVTLGAHVIINTCASVDHDCTLGDYVHIAPGAHLCGTCSIGEGAFIGAGAVVAQNVRITPWTFIKAGEVVGSNYPAKI